ncbi:glycosyltransferase family 2 protein [Photobacterium aquimaris]|uniref:N-glycosyltransferase n=1 Tax=Photobacterium aquimaris TaxID=512643 RepID=A0A1Y6L050_9GAMM|nr:glycosyltransferase family 2 protein [Photobacterium aquimaris]SMY17006.1 N-glycosyltransferase [Photobacterium aquimaris]
MGNKVKISFIIRTLNEDKYISNTINRIIKFGNVTNTIVEIVVVDSGSTDNTIKIIKDYISINSNIKLVNIDKSEWSWGRSINLGVKNSIGEYVVLISAHCFLRFSRPLLNVIELFDNKKISAVYGRQLPIDYMDPFEEFSLNINYTSSNIITSPKDILNGSATYISNAIAMYRSSDIINSPFDEEASSLEDFLWASKQALKGYSVAYVPEMSVYHSHQINVDTIYRREYYRCLESNRYLNQIVDDRKRKLIKKIVYKPYSIFYMIKNIILFYNSKIADKYKIKLATVIEYYKIIYHARVNSYYDSISRNDSNCNYWNGSDSNHLASGNLKVFCNSLLKDDKCELLPYD